MFISTLKIRAQLMFNNMGNVIDEFTKVIFFVSLWTSFSEYVNLVPTYVFIVLHQVFPNVLIFFCYCM
jgi:hypothetical protein